MRPKNFFLFLLIGLTVISSVLSACSANPTATSTAFSEINLEEALIQFPDLRVEAYPYDSIKPNEGRNFTPIGLSLEDVMSKRAAEREQPIKRQNAVLDGKPLTYAYSGLPGRRVVNVKLDGKTIFEAPYGDNSPVDPVGGLWALNGKWILELIHIRTHNENNTVYTNTRGDVIMDGISMNERFGYDESFDFQIMSGKAFYFYMKDGRIGFNYDGQHFQTDFSDIPHYACCSYAANNPFHYQNMVSFFAERGEDRLYVEIGVYPDN